MTDDRAQLDGEVAQDEAATHQTNGQIGGHRVKVSVEGLEAQDLDDDDPRIGSDVVMSRINRKFTEIKEEIADGD